MLEKKSRIRDLYFIEHLNLHISIAYFIKNIHSQSLRTFAVFYLNGEKWRHVSTIFSKQSDFPLCFHDRRHINAEWGTEYFASIFVTVMKSFTVERPLSLSFSLSLSPLSLSLFPPFFLSLPFFSPFFSLSPSVSLSLFVLWEQKALRKSRNSFQNEVENHQTHWKRKRDFQSVVMLLHGWLRNFSLIMPIFFAKITH